MMPVPERELLIAVHDVAGVVDIQRHRHRSSGIAGAVNVDHCRQHLRQLTRTRRILPAAHRRLAGKSCPRSRQLAQRQAEARIVAQGIEIISVLIAASDRQHPGKKDIIKAVDHPRRIAGIGNAPRKPPANPHRALSLSQQQHATIRGQSATVKSGCDFLAANCWKRKSGRAIIASGGCGLWHFVSRCRLGLDTQFPTALQMLTPLLPTPQTTNGE